MLVTEAAAPKMETRLGDGAEAVAIGPSGKQSMVSKWLQEHETLLWGLTAISVVTLVATLIALPLLILRLPADYFVRPPGKGWPTRRPAVHFSLLLAKNLLGLVLLVPALAMLVLPGQGLLMVLVSIVLLDFPKKHRLECWLVRRRAICRPANWIRAKGGRQPLQLPPDE